MASDASSSPSPSPPPPSPPLPAAVVVKLGGAIITDKSRRGTLRPDVLGRLCDAVAEYRGDDRDRGDGDDDGLGRATNAPRVVVVHGAGSFGHHEASESGVHLGRGGPMAMAAVRAAVLRLNAHVLSALVRRGVPAVALSPCGLVRTDAGSVGGDAAEALGRAVAALCDAGAVPVVHGDVVLDSRQRFAVLGGDAIARVAARAVGARRTVFVTNVDGLFDADPRRDPAAELRREVLVGAAGDADAGLAGAAAAAVPGEADVTGGMLAKARAAFDIVRDGVARGGTDVVVVNGAHADRVRDALRCGDRLRAPCTLLRMRPE